MRRVPEPELMLDAEQARAYAAADFSEPHARFVAMLRERLEGLGAGGRALDLGCGPGDVTLRFARALPGFAVDGIDGSPAMLALAERALAAAGLGARVRFEPLRLPSAALEERRYDCLFSNSLLHHLHDPDVLWRTLAAAGRPGAAVFVMDLIRPPSEARARELVVCYAGDEPEVLRRDFHNSLLAAFRPDEVRAQLARAGLARLQVEVVSDRHMIAWGRLPGAPGPERPVGSCSNQEASQ